MENKWNRLCEEMKKQFNVKEDKVQRVFEQIFYVIFGYDPLSGEIDAHRVMHIGSTERVIPDIIIRDSDSDKDLFIVELKQLNLRHDTKYEEQLLGYMRLLSLKVGILICDAIYVYVLENDSSKFSRKKIECHTPSKDGEQFIQLFTKGNFSVENVRDFVLKGQQFETNVNKIKDIVRDLSIRDLVALHLICDFEEDEINEALKIFTFKTVEGPTPPPPPPPPPSPPPAGEETIQDWVKRIFAYLFSKNILKSLEISNLHDKQYSKTTFGIAYALLVDKQSDTIFGGRARYWQTPIGGYYICSQWWKQDHPLYEVKITRWLNKVFPEYLSHGLGRQKI